MKTSVQIISFIFCAFASCASILGGASTSNTLPTTYECNNIVINMFIDRSGDDEYPSVAPTHSMLEICPNLDETCCDVDTLTRLRNNFMEGKKNLWKIFDLYIDTIKQFNLKKNIIKTLNSDTNAQIIKSCMGEDNIYSLEHEIKRVEIDSSNFQAELHDILNMTAKYYSGFACEICSGRFPSNFSSKNKSAFMAFNSDNMRALSERVVKMYPFLKFVLDLSRVGKAAYCLTHDSAEAFGLNINEETYERNLDFLKTCPGLSNLDIIDSYKCKMAVRKMGYTCDFRTLEEPYLLLELTKIAFMNLGQEASKVSVSSEGDGHTVFYPLNPKSNKNFDNVRLDLVPENGVNMTKNAMADKEWNTLTVAKSML